MIGETEKNQNKEWINLVATSNKNASMVLGRVNHYFLRSDRNLFNRNFNEIINRPLTIVRDIYKRGSRCIQRIATKKH